MSDKLQRIAVLQLGGKEYDLARNGRYRLVEKVGEDDYGTALFKAIDVGDWLGLTDEETAVVDDLVNALGDALTRLQAQRDSRLGRGENGD